MWTHDMPTELTGATGRWHSILPALGIEDSFLKNRKGPCPICGGKDRFRFDNKDGCGTFFCEHCGAGSGLKLVMLALRLNYKEAVEAIIKQIGTAPREAAKPKGPTDQEKRQALRDTWKASRVITREDPVGLYLKRRCGLTVFPEHLRFHPALDLWEAGTHSQHPAMIALVHDRMGEAVNIHRTYLTQYGLKAEVRAAKRAMPGLLPPGSSVRLTETGTILGIAEGIETAISANALFHVPCWAAISAPGLEHWLPPPGCKRIVIYADSDANFAGQKSAFALAYRLASDKQQYEITVQLPSSSPRDFNDIHRDALDNIA